MTAKNQDLLKLIRLKEEQNTFLINKLKTIYGLASGKDVDKFTSNKVKMFKIEKELEMLFTK